MTVVAKPVEEEKKDFIFTEVEEKQRTTEYAFNLLNLNSSCL